MRDRVNALKGENESLKRDLVEARNKKPEVTVVYMEGQVTLEELKQMFK